MGTSRSVAELAGKLNAWNAGLTNSTRDGVNKAAVMVTTSVRAQLHTVAPSGRLRGVGRNGARVSVAYKPASTPANPASLVRAVGPWQLIEGDTKAHSILPKGVGRAQGRTKAARRAAKQGLYDALFGSGGFAGVKPLAMPFGPRFRAVHPGTKGREPWKKGVRRVEHQILPTVQRETFAAMVTAFR